jgi:hypothetical protein
MPIAILTALTTRNVWKRRSGNTGSVSHAGIVQNLRNIRKHKVLPDYANRVASVLEVNYPRVLSATPPKVCFFMLWGPAVAATHVKNPSQAMTDKGRNCQEVSVNKRRRSH